MQYQQLGNTGVFVSRLGLGSMTFGTGGGNFAIIAGVQQPEADTFVGAALDAGVNYFDTADAYSLSEAEKIPSRS
jgi:aryl-alcohol dehydrogenase-like predicted oxidoreductase